jgi:4-amino-4-deoxy-L-arabinose transferase-like glycosyltransferase
LQYLGYLCLTLAVMTKGPVALALLVMWTVAAVCVSPGLRQPARQLQ